MRVFTSPACVRHDQGPGHPEQPTRLIEVTHALSRVASISLVESEPAPLDALLATHQRDYLERAAAMSAGGGGPLGPDTELNRHSWDAVLGASGAALAATAHALENRCHAFAAIRPPGHHAMRGRAMGFCVVNHVVVAARSAQRAGSERVLIVDWDVHHGNGTQALVEDDASMRLVSMHQWPWYPGTGAANERGCGNCFNVPMPSGLDRRRYVESLWDAIVTATSGGWAPQLILVSAGYDSMRGDPLGGFTLEAADYVEWIARMRERWRDAPIVAMMEGGYAPERLAEGVVATVGAMQPTTSPHY